MFPEVLIVGFMTVACYFAGHLVRKIKLPSIIGYMLIGIFLGPSCFNLVSKVMEEHLSFLTEVALAFVALGIGLELRISWLRKQGWGIVFTILGQCVGSFVLVFVVILFGSRMFGIPEELVSLNQYIAISLIFAAVATATAPAGTMAVIREYKAKGNLAKTLFAVVGYDDALAVIIFGFASVMARTLLVKETGVASAGVMHSLLIPFKEVGLSIVVGSVLGMLFCIAVRNVKSKSNILILQVGFVLMVNGMCSFLHLSYILANMLFGFIIVNTQPRTVTERVHESMEFILPLFFVFLFGLAGAHLNVSSVPSLGILGVMYIVARSGGKVYGANISATLGKLDENVRKYLGIGLLSQAGVAIGLALIVSQEFKGVGVDLVVKDGVTLTSGDIIGSVVLVTIMASCVFFEIVGPILARIALSKAGEIDISADESSA